tara:strand:+ start:8913 stop:9245 length:333 start_codon:yes stop_codon:yes gene_type:complete
MIRRNIFLLLSLMFALALSSKNIVIDVRTLDEWNEGHLSSAVRIEWQEIAQIQDLILDRNQQITLYCRSGTRSGKALKILNKLGYSNLTNAGGLIEAQELLGDKIVTHEH